MELRRQIAANYDKVMQSVAAAAGGREIELVCVTKYARDEWIHALLDAGATQLAENRLPQGSERFAALKAQGRRFVGHLIGPVQSRKVKLIPGVFDWMQAVDRLKIAGMLEDSLAANDAGIDALLQVNIGLEEQKHGFNPAGSEEAFARIRETCPRLKLRGLMTVPPGPDHYAGKAEFERGTRRCFQQIRQLFDKIRKIHAGPPAVDTLSLGMSLDYIWAIEEGATMVRVGSALYEGLEG